MSNPTEPAERVLVVPRDAFFDGAWPQGIVPLDSTAGPAFLARFERSARYLPRVAAEVDPTSKQLIPYCALVCGDDVLCVERLPGQGEQRLHGKLSIGIGGHVNPIDGIGSGTVRRALARELREELIGARDLADRARLLALLNDDANPVGRVHVGLVFAVEIDGRERGAIKIREISKMRGTFRSLAGFPGLWQDRELLESWSYMLVGELLSLMGSFRAGTNPSEGDR